MDCNEVIALATRALRISSGEEVRLKSKKKIASVWDGKGCVYEIVVTHRGKESTFVCKRISFPKQDGSLTFEDQQKIFSYDIEATFYDARVYEAFISFGCPVPAGIHTERKARKNDSLTICMSCLLGKTSQKMNFKQATAAVHWAARLHAHTWHEKADQFTNILQREGSFWHLDVSMAELENLPRNIWCKRLYRASHAIDRWLKADVFQSIIHGDFHIDNMIFQNGSLIGLCDFQYCGYGNCMRDICYMLSCCVQEVAEKGNTNKRHPWETFLFNVYHKELSKILGESRVPPFQELLLTAEICYVDLARYLMGSGRLVNAFLIPRAKSVLDKLDSGILLSTELSYDEALAFNFPRAH
jgi:hypothetical protein